jgi:putative aldouronate transport system substrate-binding protein
MLSNYGIEGNTYNKVNGVPTFTDEITKNPNGLTMVQAIYKYLLHDGPMNYHWERELSGYSKDELAAGDVWGQSDNTYGMPTALTLTADEGSRSAQIMSEIDTFVMEKNVKFIIGLEPLDKYDDFVNKIKSMKIDEVIKIQQAALDRYKARK